MRIIKPDNSEFEAAFVEIVDDIGNVYRISPGQDGTENEGCIIIQAIGDDLIIFPIDKNAIAII